MQNSTAIEQVQNYKHTLRNLTTHPGNVRVQVCSISTGRSKASNRVTKKTIICLTCTAGGQSPDNTTLSQVLDPHQHSGPYKFTDGSFLTLHSNIQKTHRNFQAPSALEPASLRGPVSSTYTQTKPM